MGKPYTLILVLLAAAACDKEPPPAPRPAAPPKKPIDKNAWKEVETPVPVGKKLSCAALLPADKLSAALGKPVTVVDDSARDPEATSVCRVLPVDKKGKPGDELCMITLGCWGQYSVSDIKKKCDARGDQTSTDIGLYTCVQTVQAGTKERHVVTVLEPDTRCRVVVNAGPYTYDVQATRGCAKAFVDLVDRESLKQ